MGISPVICGAEAPPRLCDPPCSEKQAGIGPISPKPELLTMGDSIAVDQIEQQLTAADQFTWLNVADLRAENLRLELAKKRKWLERARNDVDDPQRPDQLALLFNAAFTRSGVNGTVRSRTLVAS
jgi:hypothetical protein